MRPRVIFITGFLVIAPGGCALAGEFYNLHPEWLAMVYHAAILALSLAGALICLSIFKTLRGGQFERAWVFWLAALGIMAIRTALGFLTVSNVAYFQATLFAGLDFVFYVLIFVGLVLYKTGLN